jgi:hypothetical protein
MRDRFFILVLSLCVAMATICTTLAVVGICKAPDLFAQVNHPRTPAPKQYRDSEVCLSTIQRPECNYWLETLSTCGLDDEQRFYPVGGALADTGSYILDLLIRNARERGLTLVVLDTLQTDPITGEINADDDFYGHPQLSRWEGFVDRDGPRPVRQWTRGHTARVTKFSTNGDVIQDEVFDVKTLAELKARIWGMP